MVKKLKLAAAERNFCSLVSQASFVNPFSEERDKLDMRIASAPKSMSLAKRLEKVKSIVDQQIEKFAGKNGANINSYQGDDYILVRDTLLFSIFHKFMDRFDELILTKLDSSGQNCKVSFAKEAFSLFRKYGFTDSDASMYFAVFYQMRRAYYFINKGLVGTSSSMKKLRLNLWNNIFTQDLDLYHKYLLNKMEDFSTLLLGETGTGKGTAAVAIGRSGFIPFDRTNMCFVESFMESFVSLNLSQYTDSLIESELFGHKKGAFTGAVDTHKGIFSRCSAYGSIFLDEIGEVSVPIQIKLLQVLQERIFSPVGSHKKERFSGRVIGATNQDINLLRANGTFRDDFFYRLCSDIFTVPPLRIRIAEDPKELDALLAHTLTKILGKPSLELIDIIKKVINKSLGNHYHWPGNVRELEQCVRRIILNRTYEGDSKVVRADASDCIRDGILTGSFDAETLLKNYSTLLYKRFGTYEDVARTMKLDRRTVKKYIES